MTQTQKIIASCLGRPFISEGTRVYIKKASESDAVSFDDALCGAYSKLYIKNEIFEVPKGIFIDLCGALRSDVASEEIAVFIEKKLGHELSPEISVEFGGDSMTYLNMDDRTAIVKRLSEFATAPFCVLFECDYITALHTLENFGKKPAVFYNDGPESYYKVIQTDLSAV